MTKKNILLLLISAIFIILYFYRKEISYEIYRKVNIISAGSYPYAEIYNFKHSETEVKKALNKFKSLHPEYKVPNSVGGIQLADHQTENPSFWYISYFYFKDENEVIYTFTRENGKSETIFGLVGVEKIETNYWKNINDDFTYNENRKQIEKFEKRIFKVLNNILKENKSVENKDLIK